jgi:hypothetical protein
MVTGNPGPICKKVTPVIRIVKIVKYTTNLAQVPEKMSHRYTV